MEAKTQVLKIPHVKFEVGQIQKVDFKKTKYEVQNLIYIFSLLLKFDSQNMRCKIQIKPLESQEEQTTLD